MKIIYVKQDKENGWYNTRFLFNLIFISLIKTYLDLQTVVCFVTINLANHSPY